MSLRVSAPFFCFFLCRASEPYLNRPTVVDIFIISHFIGSFAKTLIVRNRSIMWTISIYWELLELATKHFIPNFAECWWDSLLLDVLLCNALGIECALWVCKIPGLSLSHTCVRYAQYTGATQKQKRSKEEGSGKVSWKSMVYVANSIAYSYNLPLMNSRRWIGSRYHLLKDGSIPTI